MLARNAVPVACPISGRRSIELRAKATWQFTIADARMQLRHLPCVINDAGS
jgi:hypothetical protein